MTHSHMHIPHTHTNAYNALMTHSHMHIPHTHTHAYNALMIKAHKHPHTHTPVMY